MCESVDEMLVYYQAIEFCVNKLYTLITPGRSNVVNTLTMLTCVSLNAQVLLQTSPTHPKVKM